MRPETLLGRRLCWCPVLLCDDRLWRHQADYLTDLTGPLVVGVTDGASVSEMARSLLEAAPERFSLAGLYRGGYVALELLLAPRRASSASPAWILRPFQHQRMPRSPGMV